MQATQQYGTAIELPPWVQSRLVDSQLETHPCRAGFVRTACSSECSLISVAVIDACRLPSLAFQRATVQAYRELVARLPSMTARCPIRLWNFLPKIRTDCGDGMDRYMVFNAGRYAAYSELLNRADDFTQSVATATGIGYAGADLVIHALSSNRPGRHVENPRQRPAYRYTNRFGPMPPCFARGTIVRIGGMDQLLIGGTASVLGEDSVHIDDVSEQVSESFRNIAALIRAASTGGCSAKNPTDDVSLSWLAKLASLRVYVVQNGDMELVQRAVRDHVGHLQDVEFVSAELCRPDLLVEIEGTAVLRQ